MMLPSRDAGLQVWSLSFSFQTQKKGALGLSHDLPLASPDPGFAQESRFAPTRQAVNSSLVHPNDNRVRMCNL